MSEQDSAQPPDLLVERLSEYMAMVEGDLPTESLHRWPEVDRFWADLKRHADFHDVWEREVLALRARLEIRNGILVLDAGQRARLYGMAIVGMERNRAGSIEKVANEILESGSEDFLVEYLCARLANFSGLDTSGRRRVLASLGPAETGRVARDVERLSSAQVNQPLLSVVVPTLDRRHSLERLLETLRKHTTVTYEVTVLDNACTDGTSEWLCQRRTAYPELTLFRSRSPLSTVVAYNTALAATRGEILGCMADDLEVTPGWAHPLVDHLRSRPYVGAMEPLILTSGGTLKHLGGCVPYASRVNTWMNRHGYPPALAGACPDSSRIPRQPVWVEAATFPFLRRDVFDRLDMYDPAYFHWWSDFDAAIQIRRMNLAVMIHPRSTIMDHELAAVERDAVSDDPLAGLFRRLFQEPGEALRILQSSRSLTVRAFCDNLIFECKWRAYRVTPCVGLSPDKSEESPVP